MKNRVMVLSTPLFAGGGPGTLRRFSITFSFRDFKAAMLSAEAAGTSVSSRELPKSVEAFRESKLLPRIVCDAGAATTGAAGSASGDIVLSRSSVLSAAESGWPTQTTTAVRYLSHPAHNRSASIPERG